MGALISKVALQVNPAVAKSEDSAGVEGMASAVRDAVASILTVNSSSIISALAVKDAVPKNEALNGAIAVASQLNDPVPSRVAAIFTIPTKDIENILLRLEDI